MISNTGSLPEELNLERDIQLDEGLQSGDYAGTLLVECFKKDGTALNNAKVKFDLEVTEE